MMRYYATSRWYIPLSFAHNCHNDMVLRHLTLVYTVIHPYRSSPLIGTMMRYYATSRWYIPLSFAHNCHNDVVLRHLTLAYTVFHPYRSSPIIITMMRYYGTSRCYIPVSFARNCHHDSVLATFCWYIPSQFSIQYIHNDFIKYIVTKSGYKV